MAHALQIDTLAFSEKLQAAGADVLLAKAIVEGISSADTSTLATKEDLRNVEASLRLEIAKTANSIVTRLGAIIAVMLGIVGALQFLN
tara:strand:+ start:147 stop:410 length:264 start_codon:yes stop_codon:yes gene_type:complete